MLRLLLAPLSVVYADGVPTHLPRTWSVWAEFDERGAYTTDDLAPAFCLLFAFVLLILATSMFIVGHEVGGTEEVPEVSFDVVGSTGNLYKTTIKQNPYCDCPDGAKGNQCKHICYGEYIYTLLHIEPPVISTTIITSNSRASFFA